MNITLTGTKITQDNKFLAFEKNNGVDVINITVDTDESWTYKLDVKYPEKCCSGEQLYNIINLTRNGNTCTAVLTKDMLPFTGKYIMQLRGISGDKVAHSDTFDAWVKYSIEPASTYDPVPSEFYQIEDNITEINNNPPKPSENGYWLIWDVTTHQYKESAIPLPDGTLPEVNLDTSGKYLSNDGKKAYWAEVQTGTESKIDKIEVNNVEQPIIDKTVNIAVPTNTSDLFNDSGYITNEALDSYATKADLPTKVSQLENDSKFINESALDGYAKTADIPTKTSQLNNDSGYITANDVPVKSVDGATGDVVTNAVKTTVQTLTDAQKQQARDNIGVVDVPTPSAENVGKIPVSKQVGDGYKYVMEDKSTSDLSLGLTGASVEQVPVVASVDTQGKPTTWVPSSAPGILLVTITAEHDSGESKLICDRTNAEIYEAFSAGKIVMADIPNWLSENRMRCIYANDTTARFSVVTRGSAASAIQSFMVSTSTTLGVQTVIMDDEALLITFTGSPDNAGRLITFDMMGAPFITQFNGLLYGEQDGSVTSLGVVTEDDNGKFLRVVDGMWQAVTVDNANGGSETWEKLVDVTLEEAVDTVTYTFDNCKRIKALINPALSAAVSGWKKITVNNIVYLTLNSNIQIHQGVYYKIDSEYPPYVEASLDVVSRTSVQGINGGVRTAVLENIAPDGITQFGCSTPEILIAGTKIQIWGVKS